MRKVMPVAILAFVACAAPPKGMRAETVGRPLQCFQKCSEAGVTGDRSCETFCEPQLTTIRWVPDCQTQCARFDGEDKTHCISECEQPPTCGLAEQQDHGPVFKTVAVTLAVIAFSATGAFAFQQAIDR